MANALGRGGGRDDITDVSSPGRFGVGRNALIGERMSDDGDWQESCGGDWKVGERRYDRSEVSEPSSTLSKLTLHPRKKLVLFSFDWPCEFVGGGNSTWTSAAA